MQVVMGTQPGQVGKVGSYSYLVMEEKEGLGTGGEIWDAFQIPDWGAWFSESSH